jgi:hypothetical protein
LKHPARAAGCFEVIALGPETTEVSTDTQNKEERPQLSTFYLHGRFAAKTKLLVTSEAKKCLNIGCGRLKIHFVTGKFKKYFLSFFFTPKPCYSREELAGSALANARGRTGNTPVLAKNH